MGRTLRNVWAEQFAVFLVVLDVRKADIAAAGGMLVLGENNKAAHTDEEVQEAGKVVKAGGWTSS